jgi:hypothetical protein
MEQKITQFCSYESPVKAALQKKQIKLIIDILHRNGFTHATEHNFFTTPRLIQESLDMLQGAKKILQDTLSEEENIVMEDLIRVLHVNNYMVNIIRDLKEI